ncbi:hypothetical protein DL96DRAFT_534550 [Flagelloscypha sp. PMI_526]|nr:hypothetical protein DL96DRAFT_534550 [Flagelloscypha sp. PMI_526]
MSSSVWPREIWVNICRFLPPLALQHLYEVNHIFFELAMEQRYRQISLAYLTQSMLKTLLRLQDPEIAKRVKILHLHPHFVRDILEKDALPIVPAATMRNKIYDMAKNITDPGSLKFLRRKDGACRSRSLSFRTSKDLMKIVLDVLGNLPSLEEYHIMWCGEGLSSINTAPVPFVLTAFTPTIRKLSLDVSMDKLQSLFCSSSALDLPQLESLDLSVRVDPIWEQQLSSDSERSLSVTEGDSFEPIMKLIANHRDTLRNLSLSSREPLDWAPLFFSLPCITFLQTLSLSVPACAPHFGDPSGLSFFLNSHGPTLRSLKLRVTQLSGGGIPVADEEHLDSWISAALSQVDLPLLRHLDITSSLIPTNAAVRCIRRFTNSLHTLAFTGRTLPFSDIERVMFEFDEPGLTGVPRALWSLRCLRLGTVTLSPQLFDLVSSRMPYLERLELLVKEVVPSQGDCAIYYQEPADMQDESQIAQFFDEMEKRSFPKWNIKTLGLLRNTAPFRLEPQSKYWEILHRCIPSLIALI